MSTAVIDKSYLTRPDATDLDHIPGTDGIPYFGESLKTLWGLEKLCEDHYEKWGSVSRVKILQQRGILVFGADIYQQIYLDKEQNFSFEMGFKESLGQFYEGGLLIKDFDEHKVLRRLLQGAFKTAVMQTYTSLLNPIMQRHIEQWDKDPNFLFFPRIKETLLEVGAKVFIGEERPDITAKLNQSFLDVGEGLLGQVRKEIPGTRYYKGKKGERYLRDYFQSEITKRRGTDRPDMFSKFCNEKDENGNYYRDDQIVSNAAFLLFAAHDTTTSALNHIMYYTAMNPEWQTKMRNESLALNKPFLDYDDLEKLELFDRVFFECLRIRPSVPMFTRRTIREMELGGHRIPADTMVFMTSILNHRDPQFWTDPMKFDPDRFSPERAEHKRHSFCFHPFGGGAHKCIGMQFAAMLVKTFMHQILLKYEYSLPADFTPKFEWVPLPKPAKLPLKFKRR